MADFVEYGDPARFCIAVRWVEDSEPRARRPAAHGWSMGDLRIMIGGTSLTRSVYRGHTQNHVGWYLSPLIDWIATNWTDLLHEEDFAWREPTGQPAAVACRKALHAWIDVDDEAGRETYGKIQCWYRRHGLRAAAEGGLLPDLFFRRLMDDIELSWNAAAPVFAPDGFSFIVEPGQASLAVEDIAGPLWDCLRWFVDKPPSALDAADQAAWEAIADKIDALDKLPIESLQSPYLAASISNFLRDQQGGLHETSALLSVRSNRAPVVVEFSPAVAMFGGVSPNLSQADASNLLDILTEAHGDETAELKALAQERGLSPLDVPYQDGYDFAENLLEDLDLPGELDWIDVEAVARRLLIDLDAREFESREIRGVALAGAGIHPRIIINKSSVYNRTFEGKRFTLAHELCHILHDRSRARRVTHVSGPWVAQGFERRANAFAAYFLMPRPLVLFHLGTEHPASPEAVRRIAGILRVSESALVEHMFNIRLINDPEREQLRPLFRSSH